MKTIKSIEEAARESYAEALKKAQKGKEYLVEIKKKKWWQRLQNGQM